MKYSQRIRGLLKQNRLAFALPAFFRGRQVAPEQYRQNFKRLYADIGWFGVLNGTSITFLNIYAARLGASPDQIGVINAMPALVILMLSLPTGLWLENRSVSRSVFWGAVLHRIFYLFFALVPMLFPAEWQVWALVLIIFIMNFPGTVLSLGFNALFAETVPMEWRAHVVGVRNAIFAVTSILSTLLSGVIFRNYGFPVGYQLVFFIGFLGAMLSSWNLYFLRPVADMEERAPVPLGFPAQNGETRQPANGKTFAWRKFLGDFRSRLRVEVLSGPFGRLLMLLAAFHLTQYLPIPLFPIYQVKVIGLSDQVLSVGSAMHNSAILIGSTQLAKLTARSSNRQMTGWGMILLATYPVLLAVAKGPYLYWVAMFISGLAWSAAGGSLYNYLLEKVPADSRPTYLAWFSLAVNAAILVGSLLGPVVAGWTQIFPALFLFALLRVLSGIAILRWG